MGEVLAALAIGLTGGIAGGLLGVGGGIIFVPALVLLLDVGQHTAQGISLAVIVPTAISGSLTNARGGWIDAGVARWVTPPAIVAGVAGATFAGFIGGDLLTRIFGLVLVYAGARTLLSLYRSRAGVTDSPQGESSPRGPGAGRRPPST